ncbi:TetR/AcrR family transcriptional regulator [Jeotgalibaca caeni]|uniref:TetR/AcrR family transcriptional regulator n=1 Tax=Jeotgalibaca caeni TaxID=3028623 RepID=UPI00237DDB6E|nr:TetR/AcrR family transcriptional regulator [Jeotgalibaca caeni]MDE1549340.1 TetR/AcrR family transcriptional regulator [Jeotgalibaca caeni]
MARKKTFTQEELYAATHDLILEVGYDVFSFQLLAKELDITRTALYKHYANKNELLQAYLNYQLEQVVEEIEETVWPATYAEKISLLMDIVFGYADTHAISAMVPTQKWTKENEGNPDIIKSKGLHMRFFGFIQQVIEEGKDTGFLNPEIPSMIMIETIFHSINLPNQAGLSREEYTYFVKKMLFEGILKK